MTELTHVDAKGKASMVDISDKQRTQRLAIARSELRMQPSTLEKIVANEISKGDVLSVARIAGIQGAKRCADLIPLCHPLALSSVKIEFEWELEIGILRVDCLCKVEHKTGVEMEALTGASIAALTVYDMCKGIEKGIQITNTALVEKRGGKSGTWQASK